MIYRLLLLGSSFLKTRFNINHLTSKVSLKISSIWPGLKLSLNDIQEHSQWIIGNGNPPLWGISGMILGFLCCLILLNICLNHIEFQSSFKMAVGSFPLGLETHFLISLLPFLLFPFLSKPPLTSLYGLIPLMGFSLLKMLFCSTALICPAPGPSISGITFDLLEFPLWPGESCIMLFLPKSCFRKRVFPPLEELGSRCGVCLNACESAEHLFISCSFAQLIWRWLFDCFEIHKAIPSSISELWDFINNRK